MLNKQAYDTNSELVIVPYKRGIRLIKPTSEKELQQKSIKNVSNLPFNIFFLDHASSFINLNSSSIESLGAQSMREVFGKKANNFVSKDFAAAVLDNDKRVMSSQSMIVVEEFGMKNDNTLVHVLSFKFPWYYENSVVGIFGCSIMMDPDSLNLFGSSLAQLLSTEILGSSQAFYLAKLANADYGLTPREKEILSYILQGKTAKAIGKSLQLSKRTIEQHLVNIKSKTYCQTKYDLIDKFS